MSRPSSVTTRSKLRSHIAAMEKRRGLEISDSGLLSETGPGSPSNAPTTASVQPPVIPVVGGRLIDHSIVDPPPVAGSDRRDRQSSRSSRVSSRGSRRSADYLRRRAEYEAERELLRLRENLVKKKLEVDLAEIDVVEEGRESSTDEEDTTRRIEEWIGDTSRERGEPLEAGSTRDKSATVAPPSSIQPHVRRAMRDSPASPAPAPRTAPVYRESQSVVPRTLLACGASPSRVTVGTRAPVDHAPPVLVASRDRSETPRAHRHEASPGPHRVRFHEEAEHRRNEDGYKATYERRDRGIEQLAEAITNLARPRPIPRQAYELPFFNGNPSDWISYRQMYTDTTEQYNFKPHENLARLKTSLQGEAKIAVEDLLRTSANPDDIMKALEKSFGHPVLVLECALQKVRCLPRVSPSGRELPKFAASVRNCVSLLKNIHADGYLNNPQMVNELLNKLTQSQREKYGEFAMGLNHDQGVDLRVSPNLEILSDFLDHLAHSASYYALTDAYNTPTAQPGPAKTQRNAPIPAVRTSLQGKQVQRVHVQSDEVQLKASEQSTQIDAKLKCAMCEGEHLLTVCSKFMGLSVNDRWQFAKEQKLCFKCLVKRHSRNKCRAKRCDKCSYSHHGLLHMDKTSASAMESVTNVGENHAKALLKVVPVTITDINGNGQKTMCYALLDDGATVSLLDSSLVTKLKGPKVPLVIRSARGHEVSDLTSRAVSVRLHGPNGRSHQIKCRTLVRMDLPTQTVPAAAIESCSHLRDLGCEEQRGAKPLLLLGQDNWELLVSQDVRRGKSGKPVASLTELGWVIHGPLGGKVGGEANSINCMAGSLPDLHDAVKAQFELEAIGISEDSRKHQDIEQAKAILDRTSRRTPDGTKWEEGLLWKKDNVMLPDNHHHARKRLEGIERKMDRNPVFAEAYTSQVNRLVSEGYARKVDNGLKTSPVWYLPHFGVVNPNKPGKLRLVFDAASVSRGTCLNDNLLTGPDLLNSLLGILFKFRIGPTAFSGDIADMFLRIKIREEDQGAQLFLWRGTDRKKEPETYAMSSMIFGAVSSPITAIYILNKNAGEFHDSYPAAVEAIRSKHYMDDYLDSTWTVEQANTLIEEVTKIHAAGGFVIRGWVTNSAELRERLKVQMPERVALDKGEGSTERTLGMIWSPRADRLAFDLSFKRLPEEIVNGKSIPTKREFLRFIMSIFDPLGFVYPCVIQSRILMQKIWKSGIQWDEKLNEPEADIWFKWLHNLEALREVVIPRWYGLQLDDLELHVFGDASELAYSAVAYLAGKNADGEREVAIVIGKARVAPQKVVSIPRLELQAAVLASRLACTVERELGLPIKSKYLWTDSKTVLRWINSNAHEFQRFVSHRLSEIDKRSNRSNWRWVPTGQNPADKATRWDWPSNCSEWLSGPSFLRDSQERWPACGEIEAAEEDLERAQRVHVTSAPSSPPVDSSRFSTWARAQRVMARVLAFIGRCRKQRPSTELTPGDLQEAEVCLLKAIQAECYPEEITKLKRGESLPASSKLRALDPMLYDDGLLRVRGRLSACEALNFDEKHPTILDGRHPLTRKLIHQYHAAALHANQETVVNTVREKYWVTNLRSTVKAVVSKCQLCRIKKAHPVAPKMGDLPAARLENTRRAFVHTGVDYFGPMEVTIGRRREKRWGVLFTCLATRAIHLELAASLSADSAILALRRLIARRGQPAHLYSDRGTNFVGANTELRAALKMLDHDQVKEKATVKVVDSHRGDSLELFHVQRNDMGAYYCIASNGIPPTISRRYHVEVHFIPQVKVTNQLVGAPLGSNVELQCYIEASPKAMNSWYREDAPVSDKLAENPKLRVHELIVNEYSLWMNLSIKSLAPGDYGTYVCASVNALGKTENQVSLHRLELSMNGFGAEEPMVSGAAWQRARNVPAIRTLPAASHAHQYILTHHLPPQLYALLVTAIRYIYSY